jgi:hypothetical protein
MRKKVFTRQLAVLVSEDTWKRILDSTNEAEVSISNWIREAIEAKLTFNGFSNETQIKNSRKEH